MEQSSSNKSMMRQKKKYLLSCSSQPKARWRQINASLNDAYQADKTEKLIKQLKELRIADGRAL